MLQKYSVYLAMFKFLSWIITKSLTILLRENYPQSTFSYNFWINKWILHLFINSIKSLLPAYDLKITDKCWYLF